MNADGTGQMNLTADQAADFSPAWSPDGQAIAFSSNRTGDAEIYITRADGSATLRMTNNPGADTRPRWRPRPLTVADTPARLVVQPTGVADIRTAVEFAQEHGGLLLAVKCGGHSYSGQSTCGPGMQVDLMRFRDVRVGMNANVKPTV